MPSLDDLIAAIDAARERVAELAAGVARATGTAEAISGRLRGIGTVRTADRIAGAGTALEEGQTQLDALAAKLDAARAHVEMARGGGSGGGGGRPPGPPPVPAAGGGDRPVPPLARRLSERLPDREPGAKTRLYAYSHDDGAEVEFVSGRDRTAREGLTPEYARRFVVRDHAEGHVAATMRKPNGPHETTVVINNEPCGGPTGCDATIPHIIPEDARMNVYLKTSGGVRWYATYTGTGEGIE